MTFYLCWVDNRATSIPVDINRTGWFE